MGSRNNFSRCRYVIYLHRVPGCMPNPQCSFDVRSSGKPGNERTSQSYMENITYNYTLTCGTCESLGSVYSFCINVYDRSYFPGTTNQRPDKRRRRANQAILTCDMDETFSITFTRVIFPCVVRKDTGLILVLQGPVDPI